MSAYSSTPLAKKLGIKSGDKIRLINHPDYYIKLFSDFPDNVKIIADKKTKKNFIHYFVFSENDLRKNILQLKNEIEQNGIIWISWHKKSSKIKTDVTENIIRDVALPIGLVDIKVCAIDDVWSGLKLMIRVSERK